MTGKMFVASSVGNCRCHVVLVRVALWEIREGEERLKWKKEKAGQIKDTVPVSVDGFFFIIITFV